MNEFGNEFCTRQEVTAYCMNLPDVYEDYPFDDGAWTVMRHKQNKKSFAMIFERGGVIWVNVKCEPMTADFLRSVYPSVIPAYHMNKVHWNSIILDCSIPRGEIEGMIMQSYHLTKAKIGKR